MADPATERAALYHVVMLSFEGPDRAAAEFDRLKIEGAFDGCEIEGASVISRDAGGRIHVHERGGAGVGAAIGTAAAGVVGLVTGPVILPLMLAAGAVVGGIAGHFAGQILPADDLRRVAETLQPGTSAFVAVIDTEHAQCVIDAFGEDGEVMVDTALETELSNAIREAVLHQVRRV